MVPPTAPALGDAPQLAPVADGAHQSPEPGDGLAEQPHRPQPEALEHARPDGPGHGGHLHALQALADPSSGGPGDGSHPGTGEHVLPKE